MNRALAAVALIAALACGNQPAAVTSPSRTSASASPSPAPSPSPSPTALQRTEPSLPLPIEETAAAAAGGRLYVMGGFNAAGTSLSSVYVFDGSGWTSGPRLPLPLDHPSATSLGDHVYIAGGHSNGADSGRLYRLDADHWTQLASMHYPRGGHALVAADGRLYAIGGNTSRGNVGPSESYDPLRNSWTVLGSLAQPRNHVMGFRAGAEVCVAGGRSPATARVDCLDLSQQRWHTLNGLPRATSGGGAASFDDGIAVTVGGQDATETRIVDQLAYYRPGQGWSSPGTMLAPRHGFELAIFSGRAWACGGGSAPGLHPVATCTSVGDAGAS